MISFPVIAYPQIGPDLIALGPIHIRWYGIMYIVGFLAGYFLIQKQERSRQIGLVGTMAQDFIFYLAVGVIIGGRLGYVVFYQYHDYLYYLKNPIEIIATWHGGMSFHGGMIGAALAGWIFCRRRKLPFLAVADSATVTAPLGLGFGRIGNFINAELWGRPSDVPWAMVFPDAGPLPRHPSQLYESLLEGFLLFTILWMLRRKPFRDGMMIAFFMIFYGIFRFFLEFFREPDPQIGFLLGFLTMGQLLCFAMVLSGVILAAYIHRTQPARTG